MAATRKSIKPVRTDIILAAPHKLRECIQVQVGGTVIWQCGKPTYPEFHLTFADANPFNSRQNAKFKGSKDQPITLVFKNEGTFRFKVTHIKKDASTIDWGPFCITIIPLPICVIKPPPGCPPRCGGSGPLE
jgi:hypothetical protein